MTCNFFENYINNIFWLLKIAVSRHVVLKCSEYVLFAKCDLVKDYNNMTIDTCRESDCEFVIIKHPFLQKFANNFFTDQTQTLQQIKND